MLHAGTALHAGTLSIFVSGAASSRQHEENGEGWGEALVAQSTIAQHHLSRKARRRGDRWSPRRESNLAFREHGTFEARNSQMLCSRFVGDFENSSLLI